MQAELARAFDLGGDHTCSCINVSENETFKIETRDGRTFALRLNRPGYHTAEEIASEMAWLESLNREQVIAAAVPVPGRDGHYLQQLGSRQGVLFQWQTGVEPMISDDLCGLAQTLGGIAARLHDHVTRWRRPALFTRPRWDFAAALGDAGPRWGHWRDGLGVTPAMLPLLQRTVDAVAVRLAQFGQSPQRFNLIHGDLRLANVLIEGKKVKVIDFDDSGFGWFMYDAATMVSFHEHEAQVPELMAHWVEGYRRVRPLRVEDEKEINTFIMFRRLLLLAWLGSHTGIDLAQRLKAQFAEQTTGLCEAYLSRGQG